MGISYSLGWYELQNGEMSIKGDREISEDEFIKIGENSKVLSIFNMNYNYYDMMNKNYEEVLRIINEFEQRRESFKYEMESVPYFRELNRLLINALGSFYCFLNHFDNILKSKSDKDATFKLYKKICSNYYDNTFEYRFSYKLRNYAIHRNIPVSLLQSTQHNPNRSFYINIRELLSVGFDWGRIVKQDLENLSSNIDVKSFIIATQNMLFDLNKDLMTLDINEIINSLNYLKDFMRINNDREAQMPVVVIHDTDDLEKAEIKSFGDNFIEAAQIVAKFHNAF